MLMRYILVGVLLVLFGAGCAKQAPTLEPLVTVQPTPADDLPLPEQEPEDTEEELDQAEQEDDNLPNPSIEQDELPPPAPSAPSPSPPPSSPSPQPIPVPPFVLSSSAFASGGVIPVKYSCDGQDLNPPLSWSGAPAGTKSFALIIDDPDAVSVVGKVVDHWVLWNISSAAKSITEGSVPPGASQGRSYDASKYQGPCPPSGTSHRYFFKLYALDVERLDLPASTSGKALEGAMQGHIIKKTELVGRFTAK